MVGSELARVRRVHEDRVLRVVREWGPLSRGDLELRTGLSRKTVSDITSSLLERRIIVSVPSPSTGERGRPPRLFALASGSGRFVGVDFGRQRVLVAAVSPSNEVIAQDSRRYADDAPWSRRVETALALIDDLEREQRVDLEAVEGVGVGVSGPVGASAIARSASWAGAATRHAVELVNSTFTQRFAAPVVIDNNDRYAALAEMVWGSARDVDHLLYVRSSYGVGGGLVIDGRPVAGSHGMAGEIGHITVPGEQTRCWCGKRGCLETVISIGALVESARQHDPSVSTIGDIADRIGEPAIDALIARAAHVLATALATITVVMDPREVVVAGSIADLGEPFFRALTDEFEQLLMPARDVLPTPRPSTLGDEAGALGAIADAVRRTPLSVTRPTAVQTLKSTSSSKASR